MWLSLFLAWRLQISCNVVKKCYKRKFCFRISFPLSCPFLGVLLCVGAACALPLMVQTAALCRQNGHFVRAGALVSGCKCGAVALPRCHICGVLCWFLCRMNCTLVAWTKPGFCLSVTYALHAQNSQKTQRCFSSPFFGQYCAVGHANIVQACGRANVAKRICAPPYWWVEEPPLGGGGDEACRYLY